MQECDMQMMPRDGMDNALHRHVIASTPITVTTKTLHRRESIHVHPLIKAYVPKCLPVLCESIVAYQDELTRHITICVHLVSKSCSYNTASLKTLLSILWLNGER